MFHKTSAGNNRVPKIAFVDDEVSVLNSIRRGLRQHQVGWEVRYFESAEQAMGELKAFQPWVVVSDKRMPKVNGVEFLGWVRREMPTVIRIMLTGDIAEQILTEVSEVVQMLLSKPFEMNQLIDVVCSAIHLQDLPIVEERRCELGQFTGLPVIPRVYLELQAYLRSDEAGLNGVARIVSQDPGIAARVLQLANSPFLSGTQKADTIQTAVTRLGSAIIKALVLSAELNADNGAVSEPKKQAILSEALSTASISGQLAKHADFDVHDTERLFALSMVHNLGRFITDAHSESPAQTGPIRSFSEEDTATAYLLSLWSFETGFVDTVLYQTSPESFPEADQIRFPLLLHAARLMVSHPDPTTLIQEDSEMPWDLLTTHRCSQAVRLTLASISDANPS